MALTQYELSRSFWDFAFENPDLVKPTHISIFFFAIEHCNRLGWKDKFGLPTSMVIEAIGINSYNTFRPHFDNLVKWGFIKVIESSKNQYSSNIVALSTGVSKSNKALDKALIKHSSKHLQSTCESIGSIDKPITINKEPIYTPEQTERFSFFNLWIMANAKRVSEMKEPFTIDQFIKLKEDFTNEQIQDYLTRMHNHSKLKNNISAYLTFRKWTAKDGVNKPASQPKKSVVI